MVIKNILKKHFESRFTRFYESYWLPKKFGYDTRKVQYSSLILTKQMTRKDALEKLKHPAYDNKTIHQDFEYIATKLGISVKELQSYMDAQIKHIKTTSHKKNIYNIGAKVMRILGLEKGGKDDWYYRLWFWKHMRRLQQFIKT